MTTQNITPETIEALTGIDATERSIDPNSSIPEGVQRMALRCAWSAFNEENEADRRVNNDRVTTIIATSRMYGATLDDILFLSRECEGWAGIG